MAGLQVTDVLAVGVMRLIEGPVPDKSQPQRRWRIRRRQRPEQPELQVITQITGISILHTNYGPHVRQDHRRQLRDRLGDGIGERDADGTSGH